MSRRLFALLVVCLITSCIFAYRGHQGTQPESSRQGTQPESSRQGTQPESSRQGLAKRVFDRYVQALGGQGAYAKISTRSLKGKFEYRGSLQTTPGGFEAQEAEGTVEIYWKAPNRVAQVLLGPPLAVRRSYNGKDAWGFHPQAGVRKISPAEITEIIRDGALYQPIALSNYLNCTLD